MPQEEQYRIRNFAYSAWHRRDSIARYAGLQQAEALSMIDVDGILYVEYDNTTKEPLVLIETALDVGQTYKSASVITALARRCTPTLPAYVVLYKLDIAPNPADMTCQDIASFRVKRVWPNPQQAFSTLSPGNWVDLLLGMRQYVLHLLKNEQTQPKETTWNCVGVEPSFAPC